MKKIVALLIVFCFVNVFSAAALGAPPGDGSISWEVLLEEDFDTAESETGQLIFGWNGWTAVPQFSDRPDDDSKYTIEAEPENPENKVGSFFRPDGKASTTKNNFISKNLSRKADSGIVSIKFRVRGENDKSSYFMMRIPGIINGETKNWEIQIYFKGCQILENGSTKAYFNGSTPNNKVEATLGEWYDFEFLLNLNTNTITYYEGGSVLAEGVGLGVNFCGEIETIRFGTNRAVESGGLFYFDDLKIEATMLMDVIDSLPKEGEQEMEIGSEIKVTLANHINPASISDLIVLLNGTADSISSCEIDSTHKNILNITLNEPLEYGTYYELEIGGLKDFMNQTMPDRIISFKTRGRQMLFDEPVFYIGDNDITQEGLQSGTLRCVVNGTNENLEERPVVLISALFENDCLIGANAVEEEIAPLSSQLLETTLFVPSGEEYSVRTFIWDSIRAGNPLSDNYAFTSSGLTLNERKKGSPANLSVNAFADHESGRVFINGSADEDAEISILALRPGYTIKELTADNVSSALEFAGQTSAQDKEYSFEYTLTGDYRQDKKTHMIYTNGGASTTFKLFSKQDTENIIGRISELTYDQFLAALAKNNPVPIYKDIILSDVLQIDLNGYYNLKEKEAVLLDLKNKNLTNFISMRNAFIESINLCIDTEEHIADILEDINNAPWDNLEQLFKHYDDLLNLDWGSSFAKLNKTSKVRVYKILASDYTFESIKEVQNAFTKEANEAYNEQNQSDTGLGGAPSGKGKSTVITSMADEREQTSAPKSEAPVFSDIAGVEWAKEAIINLSLNNIVEGVGNGLYAPDNKVTREQFVKMLVITLNLTDNGAQTDKFADIDKYEWYYPYVASAVRHGIVNGIEENLFGIGRDITRADMAVMVCRAIDAAGLKLPEKQDPKEFMDESEIPQYAIAHVKAMQQAGIIEGVGNLMFEPFEPMTRAMAAKVIYQLYEQING